jgi:D-alanyl-lipoteichoic acid acyltransferase DltB (MBOAT superfamily)
MLFNSHAFLFGFLPLTLLVFHALRRAGCDGGAFAALTLLSLVFYGWWDPRYVPLLVGLVLVDFAVAKRLVAARGRRPGVARAWLAVGVAINLAALGYFKYANFLVDNVNALFGLDLFLARIVLPIGLSFYTFQKIAFLVDTHRGLVDRVHLVDYGLFVSFFPQLIAGPIVHHSEVMGQFRARRAVAAEGAALGLTVFAVGLAKKVLLADTAARYASPGFAAAAAGVPLDFAGAWGATLAYAAQIYFDFSGYSDMAIGAALLFGVRLPVNFASPYRATNIIDFWRRWHITLSRFLRDYLYIPLGGSRAGRPRRYLNLAVTMLLGGLWHGAAWTFVLWGALHGLYLAANHAWRAVGGTRRAAAAGPAAVLARGASAALTFFAVTVAWVFFRAADLPSAWAMLRAMAGANGVAGASVAAGAPALGLEGFVTVAVLLGIAWFAPNTQELTGYRGPGAADAPPLGWGWSPASRRWAVAVGGLAGATVLCLTQVSEFIYFQF